jgi:molybdate transport system substrate-binding protein
VRDLGPDIEHWRQAGKQLAIAAVVQIAVLILAGLLAACAAAPTPTAQPAAAATATTAPSAGGSTLTVFAAASLTASFTDLGKAFAAANPGSRVVFSFAGSQALRTQLTQGAKADIFASADTSNMDQAQTAGLIQGNVSTFAYNRLIVIAPKDNPAAIRELKDLAKSGLKLDIADAGVPAGSYTLQMLDKLSADPAFGSTFSTTVLARVVSKESDVKQVVAKVVLGEADAGVVYATDAQADASKLTVVNIPDQYNVIATYPIAVVKGSANAALAQKLIALLLSADGQAIMSTYGFAAP